MADVETRLRRRPNPVRREAANPRFTGVPRGYRTVAQAGHGWDGAGARRHQIASFPVTSAFRNSKRVGLTTCLRSTTSERVALTRLPSSNNLRTCEFAATQVVPTVCIHCEHRGVVALDASRTRVRCPPPHWNANGGLSPPRSAALPALLECHHVLGQDPLARRDGGRANLTERSGATPTTGSVRNKQRSSPQVAECTTGVGEAA